MHVCNSIDRCSNFPYELLSGIGFFLISAIHQVAQFCSFAGIATFNFAPQSDPKRSHFFFMSKFKRPRKRTPKFNTFDIGVRARGCKIRRNAQGFSSKVAPQCALRFGSLVEITQEFSLLFKFWYTFIKITQGFSSPGDRTVRRA